MDAIAEFTEVSIGGLPISAIPVGASSQLFLGLPQSAEKFSSRRVSLCPKIYSSHKNLG
jgi:hypothetical protein